VSDDEWEKKAAEARAVAANEPPHVRAMVELALAAGEMVRRLAKRDPITMAEAMRRCGAPPSQVQSMESIEADRVRREGLN
jgi:hypothetical protein